MEKKFAGTFFIAIVFALMLVALNCVGTMTLPRASEAFAAETETNEKTYAASGIMPLGGTITNTYTETVSYSRVETEEYKNPYSLPPYIAENVSDGCAVTAGGAVIGHFDRLYDELIPNHSGISLGGRYIYRPQNAQVDAMFLELAAAMGTGTGMGTSVSGYISGMQSYVSGKGRTASISSVYNGALNESEYKSALESGKLVTIFVDGFELTNLIVSGGTATMTNTRATGAHTLTAYGYAVYRFFNAAGSLVREEKFLHVNSGFSEYDLLTTVRLTGGFCTVDDGYSINIY